MNPPLRAARRTSHAAKDQFGSAFRNLLFCCLRAAGRRKGAASGTGSAVAQHSQHHGPAASLSFWSPRKPPHESRHCEELELTEDSQQRPGHLHRSWRAQPGHRGSGRIERGRATSDATLKKTASSPLATTSTPVKTFGKRSVNADGDGAVTPGGPFCFPVSRRPPKAAICIGPIEAQSWGPLITATVKPQRRLDRD